VPDEELDFHDLLGLGLVPVQTSIFRRSALEKIGPFDTELTGTDDWDIEIRMAAEFRVVGLKEKLARARRHDAQQSRVSKYQASRAELVLEKHAKNAHPRCEACREAIFKSRHILNKARYRAHGRRASEAWRTGRYMLAGRELSRAALRFPPARQRIDRLFCRVPYAEPGSRES
jgi:hypothetical protein